MSHRWQGTRLKTLSNITHIWSHHYTMECEYQTFLNSFYGSNYRNKVHSCIPLKRQMIHVLLVQRLPCITKNIQHWCSNGLHFWAFCRWGIFLAEYLRDVRSASDSIFSFGILSNNEQLNNKVRCPILFYMQCDSPTVTYPLPAVDPG